MSDNLTFKMSDDGKTFSAARGGTVIGHLALGNPGPNTIIVESTAVAEKFRGGDIGSRLMAELVNYARGHKKTILPVCKFARVMFARHPDWADVLHKR